MVRFNKGKLKEEPNDNKTELIKTYQSSEPSFTKANNLFAPPIEFFPNIDNYYVDPFTNPVRYQLSGYNNGYQYKEGWMYKQSQNINHIRIAQCILLYKTEGIVQTIVHLLADFVVENINLIHLDLTVHNFYQAWSTKVNLKGRLHRFVVDLLTTGNVFIWTQLAKLKPNDEKDMKRGVASELIGDDLVITLKDDKKLRHKTINVKINDGVIGSLKDLNESCQKEAFSGRVNEVVLKADTRNQPANPDKVEKVVEIPWNYISLNPLQMEPRGSRFANEHYWVMLIHQRDLKPLSKFMTYRYYNDINITDVNLPEVLKGKLQPIQNKGTPYSAELKLDKNRLSVIHDVTKADYEDWATPQIYPACKEINFKRMLRVGEISAMESLKHMITLIKLGNTKEGFVPTTEQKERVAAALAGGSQTHYLIWDDLIDGQVLQPNIGNIFDPKKYEQVDKDIYASLGVSESVFSGSSSYANSFMSIKLLLEKLETIREKLEEWLRIEVKKIADSLNFRRLPIIQWGLMNLRDENTERKLWLDLYDRGIVSDQSILERFGTDFDIETERQKLEKTIKEKENTDISKPDQKFRSPVMVSRGPFNRDLMNKQQSQQKGRPVQTGKPLSKKRDTKPKGLAGVLEFQKIYNFAKSTFNEILKQFNGKTKAEKLENESKAIELLFSTTPFSTLDVNLVYKEMPDIINELKSELINIKNKEDKLNLISTAYAGYYYAIDS